MSKGYETQRIYCELAEWYEAHSQAQMRDRFLLLAADAALSEGAPEEAERLRQRLLQHSPHHMLKPYASFAEALRSPDVQGYINDLRRTYPLESAEQLLMSLRSGEEPGQQSAALPAPPVIPAPAPDDRSPARPAEPLKVYRVRDEEASAAAPRPAAPPPPRKVPPAPPPRPAARPALVVSPLPTSAKAPATRAPAVATEVPVQKPVPAPPRREPAALRPIALPRPIPHVKPAQEEENAEGNGWVAVTLFGLVLVVGVALGVYMIARPFLPPQWLP
jgi:hypothetical protein